MTKSGVSPMPLILGHDAFFTTISTTHRHAKKPTFHFTPSQRYAKVRARIEN
jgi:hypothetical protein